MDSNYEWQKHRASERHAAWLRDAQSQRLLKGNSPQQIREEHSDERVSLRQLLARLFRRGPRSTSGQERLQKPQTADGLPQRR